jgi:hypothetical protein
MQNSSEQRESQEPRTNLIFQTTAWRNQIKARLDERARRLRAIRSARQTVNRMLDQVLG